MTLRGFVSHLDLNVADPARSVEFYGVVLEHLGYERHPIAEDRCWWSLRYPGGSIFGIEVRRPAQPSPSTRHERYSPGIDHLAFHAESRADVDALHEVLISSDYAVVSPPAEYDYAPGYYAVAFDDPSGIRLEVVHDPTSNP